MALVTKADLRTRVADYLARPEADISTEFDAALAMFEDELNADPDVRVAEMETFATLMVTNSAAALPTDLIELRNVVGPNGDVSGSYYLSGLQLIFTDDDGDTDDASGISQVTVSYYAKLPALVNDSDTNWLMQKYPHLYLYGVLSEMGIWLADASMIQIMEGKKNQAFEKLRGGDRSRRWAGMASTISGPTP